MGAADFGGGDELHCLGDLLGVFDGVDAVAEVAEAAEDGGGGAARGGEDVGFDGEFVGGQDGEVGGRHEGRGRCELFDGVKGKM